ncbi:MAG TPA: alpha/beta fold hydrolase [Allosphingosinicella sp.]|nr:alpha/beta fold hydrolase [Allosphingosinicella sp.]
MAAKLEVRLIGELALFHDGRALPLPASRKTRALFVYLLQLRRPVRRERLCELFFDIPDDPRAALRWSLSKIRAMLGPFAGALAGDRERVELDGGAIFTDVDRLRHWLGGAALPGEVHGHAEAALEPPLPGLDLNGLDSWNAWLAAERADIDQVRAAFLARAAQDAGLTPEHRHLFGLEAGELGHPPLALPGAIKAASAGELAAQAANDVDSVEAVAAAPLAGPSPRLDQHIHYCFAGDGARIAYASTGAGPPLVKAANWLNHLELDWTGPVWGRIFSELSRHRRLVRYDERGNGLSDWEVEDLSFEAFVRDLETVADHLGLERFPLLGISQGCAVSIEYAARHPHRVSHLILLGGYAAGWRHSARPAEAAAREAAITLAGHGWGQDNPACRQLFSQTFMPSATHEELDWFNDFQRGTASPANAVRFLRAFADIDVRHRLTEVRCPTLVLHARADQRVPMQHAIQLASSIPKASLVTLDSDNHIPLSREPATGRIVECVTAFLRTAPEAAPLHRRQLVARR